MPERQAKRGAPSRGLFEALNHASLAVARAERPEEMITAAAAVLVDLGFHVNVYERRDDDRAYLVHQSYAPRLVARIEALTGLDAATFSVAIDEVPLFADVLRRGVTRYLPSTRPVLAAIVGPRAGPVAATVARLLGIGRLIAAPVRSDDRIRGMLVVLSNTIAPEQTAAVEAFAHLLGRTLARAELTDRLQQSLTELEATQAQLLHASKLDAIGRLTAGIAHDFNNLLTPAMFAVEDLRSGQAGPEVIADLEASLARAAKLTQQLLAFGRKQLLAIAPTDLNALVRRSARLLDRVLGDECRCALSLATPPAFVMADPGQLEQVLLNLAMNARDATLGGGSVTLETAEAPEGLADPSGGELIGAVRLTVRDDGVGMTPEVLATAFEPFFTTKDPGAGTGVGLAVVMGIVKQHGGEISVESSPEQGTRVDILLPRAAAPRPSTGRGEAQADCPLEGAVWVIEDDDDVRRVIAEALREHGASVSEAASLAAARALAEQAPEPALIVCDIQLPDGHSLDFVEAQRARTRRAAILLVSGNPLDDAVARRAYAVSDRYLSKPFQARHLLEAAHEVLRRHATRPA